jgi:hypothetical protein
MRHHRPQSTTETPRTRRGIILLGLLLCVVVAVGAAYLLGLLDQIGLLS